MGTSCRDAAVLALGHPDSDKEFLPATTTVGASDLATFMFHVGAWKCRFIVPNSAPVSEFAVRCLADELARLRPGGVSVHVYGDELLSRYSPLVPPDLISRRLFRIFESFLREYTLADGPFVARFLSARYAALECFVAALPRAMGR